MDAVLRAWVRDDFGLDVAEITPVRYGADVAAQVWKAAAGNSRYAVKWSGAGTDTGHRTAAFLAERGITGVPRPRRTSSGELWTYRDGKRLTVTDWIDGDRAADTGLTLDQWTQYGVLLARVHSVEPPAVLRDALPRRSPIATGLLERAAALRNRLETQPPRDRLDEALIDVWKRHRDTIAALTAGLPPEPNGPRVICHADAHLGNVLVDDRAVYLIDWDDVVFAPREQDLMFHLGGMGTLGPTADEQLKAFFSGYGTSRVGENAVRYYRHLRALEDVTLWSEQVLTGPDRQHALDILEGVLGPDGLAVLAVTR